MHVTDMWLSILAYVFYAGICCVTGRCKWAERNADPDRQGAGAQLGI